MNWDALGALAELGGAVAVIATLVYLSVQIRQNTRESRATSSREILMYSGEFHREVARDPELRRIMWKSFETPIGEYSDDEWNELNFLLKAYFLSIEAQYTHGELDVGSSPLIKAHIRPVRTCIDLGPPGGSSGMRNPNPVTGARAS